MNTAPPTVLLLDDDAELAQLLSEYLSGDGFVVLATAEPAQALGMLEAGKAQVLLLDVMLGRASGFDVLRQVRARGDTPVIMLTARGDALDRILGLELGADDYVAKPFDPRELAARIRAVLRRAHANDLAVKSAGTLALGDVRMDLGARRVLRGGETVALTGVEFNLLEVLLRHAGRLISREELFKQVLGRRLVPFDRSIDMHVSNLRRKLGHRVGPVERIQAIRGEGYIYTLPSDHGDDAHSGDRADAAEEPR